MKRMSRILKLFLKLTVVFLCLAGFTYQTFQFMLLYWTYPTVVDIQESLPTEVDVPGISFCSSNSVKPIQICEMGGLCFPNYIMQFIPVCRIFPEMCIVRNRMPSNFMLVTFLSFMRENDLNGTMMDELRVPVKDFLRCKIIRGSKEIECDMDDVIIGSYFSDSTLFNLCYTINSLWGNPKKRIKKIGKYDKLVLDFYVDNSGRGRSDDVERIQLPGSNMPSTNTAIQLVVHSPYTSVSPYASGFGFLGGKRYQIRLKREEKHLLPPPYQTNCTDYMSAWISRGGIAPLNQMMVVEECKFNKTLEMKKCVPLFVDYPHNETICRHCSDCKELTEIAIECSELLNHYTQPCDFETYKMQVDENNLFVEKKLRYLETEKNESIIVTQKGHDCSFKNIWKQKCQEIKIEIVFDDFLVYNLTYNPKIESSQLFSAIGGYMGLYLGVSIVTMYDVAEWLYTRFCRFVKKKQVKFEKKRIRKNKVYTVGRNSSAYGHFRRRNINPAFFGPRW